MNMEFHEDEAGEGKVCSEGLFVSYRKKNILSSPYRSTEQIQRSRIHHNINLQKRIHDQQS